MNDFIRSTKLFSAPSTIKGIARVVDIFGNLDEYNYQENADAKAIQMDWENVGVDISNSIKIYEQKKAE